MPNSGGNRGLSVMFWNKLKDTTNEKLQQKNILDVQFANPPKNDGSYIKAKGVWKYTYWAYAVKLAETWIEFEIKQKNKKQQQNIYDFLLMNRTKIEKSLGKKLRWNDEDIEISNRRKTGMDFRIKLISDYNLKAIPQHEETVAEEWSNDMVNFIASISPYLQ